jgi:hypothetical protein
MSPELFLAALLLGSFLIGTAVWLLVSRILVPRMLARGVGGSGVLMATSSGYSEGLMQRYGDMSTAAALSGIVHVVFAALYFLPNTSMTVMSWSPNATQIFFIGVAAFAFAYVSSDNRQWEYYESYEKVIVGGSLLTWILPRFWARAAEIMETYPQLVYVLFGVSIVGYLIVSR